MITQALHRLAMCHHLHFYLICKLMSGCCCVCFLISVISMTVFTIVHKLISLALKERSICKKNPKWLVIFNTHEKTCVLQCLWFHAFPWTLFHEAALQGTYVLTCAVLFVFSKECQTHDVLFNLCKCEHEFQSAPTRTYS